VSPEAVAERMTQKIDMEWVIVRPVVLLDKAKRRYTAGPSARVAPLVPLCRFSFTCRNYVVEAQFYSFTFRNSLTSRILASIKERSWRDNCSCKALVGRL
jgi:hypothetical protein